ncbi:transporter [Pedobacter antarcticus 4BY]|uniref:Transporter n=2 Tax=Pedobacter antarcticus TaxID=34086 RepID=A0A081PC52_9SPHI|nr:BCCT family transporter [Pedobacter antarcticus]KEQ28275.1 transporter [Pedobacter antarcticus 4BY]SFE47412.1 choline/glycine/proline betaine transport protein [Pedobacter antarcticus]
MNNIQRTLKNSTFKPGIIVPSLIFIISVTLVSSFFPIQTALILDVIKTWIFVNLNWVYVWSVTIFVIFLLVLTFSKYGTIRLGDDDEKPEHSFFSWISMLFAAGMGIGLMYFGVAEPMSHYTEKAFSGLDEVQRSRNAQLYTFFHWGIHAWAVYGIVGLSLAYFTFRFKLPLSLRSCFYPILKNRINGPAGDAIDTFALCSTFFGITTTLGFGVVQLNAGLVEVGVLKDTGFWYQAGIVLIIMLISVISATSGVNKGVKYLSQLNIIAAITLMVFILILGPTVFLLGSFSEGIGNYLTQFFTLTFNTHAYDEATQPWFFNWTILYWAWWISWSPYVGLFIARISRGRTIREFIGAVLIIPTFFNFLWMTVFGNSATWLDRTRGGVLSSIVENTDKLLFEFLGQFPISSVTSILAIFIIFIFFITSADSGIFVMDNIASNNAKNSPKWQLIFWGVLLGLLSLVLLNAGGLQSLQTMTLITALPFSLIMCMFCYSLIVGLRIDYGYYKKGYSPATTNWSGEFWKERLDHILSYKKEDAVNSFIAETVRPALDELANAFQEKQIVASVSIYEHPFAVEITIKHKVIEDFKYGVKTHSKVISEFLVDEINLPGIKKNSTFIPVTYFGDNRPGYNIEYFSHREIIADALKQYERFIELSSDVKNEMFLDNTLKDSQ